MIVPYFRCIGDEEQNDWVHKEIATALQSECNIIPITDDFNWPQPESLPEDIRKVGIKRLIKLLAVLNSGASMLTASMLTSLQSR